MLGQVLTFNSALIVQRIPAAIDPDACQRHTESTLRQYTLADTAVALGWAPRDVEMIDRDLGLSGTSAAHRERFPKLMSRVCLREIGAVFGLEISRLGRSKADLARLAEMGPADRYAAHRQRRGLRPGC